MTKTNLFSADFLEDMDVTSDFYRGDSFIPQGVGGYDENWYPVCLADEILDGEIHGFAFLDGRVIVYRPAHNQPIRVMSAFCRHLGVDLSVGRLVGDRVQCAYHHWQYDQDGKCVATAVGDDAPDRAKLFAFPTEERFGIVWAYNGETPAYEVPHFQGFEEDELTVSALRSVEMPTDPFVLYSNSMDIQHLISVHGIRYTQQPDEFQKDGRTISYWQEQVIPGLGETRQDVRLWGTNCITLQSKIGARPTLMMSAGLAVAGPVTRTFNVTATPRDTSKAGEDLMIEQHIKMVEQFGLQLNREDDPVLRSISIRIDNLTEADYALKVYFEHVRNYPRSTAATDSIRNDYKRRATLPGPEPEVLTDIVFDPAETGHK
ncbi:MAG: Rieske (2Fe-2S) protein [Parvibaculaceae bacterium]